MLSTQSVFPVCDAKTPTILRFRGSDAASMKSRWYGAREVRHCPGDALDSAESWRSASAHWLTVRVGGGRSAHRALCRISLLVGCRRLAVIRQHDEDVGFG